MLILLRIIDKNSPPVANAGGNQVLYLPLPILILNGSKSSDDFRIVSWKWTRSGIGLAAGTVVQKSDTEPVLMVSNLGIKPVIQFSTVPSTILLGGLSLIFNIKQKFEINHFINSLVPAHEHRTW